VLLCTWYRSAYCLNSTREINNAERRLDESITADRINGWKKGVMVRTTSVVLNWLKPLFCSEESCRQVVRMLFSLIWKLFDHFTAPGAHLHVFPAVLLYCPVLELWAPLICCWGSGCDRKESSKASSCSITN